MSDQPDRDAPPGGSDPAVPSGMSEGRRGRAPDGGPYNPPPPAAESEQLAELTVQVARLRRLAERGDQDAATRHDELRRDVADARAAARRDAEDLVAALRRDTEDQLVEIGATLREHAQSLHRVLSRQQRATAAAPVPWHSLGAAEATREWDLLAEWIDQVFVPWGEITRRQLPDCWALHRPILVQLSWLRTAHIQAYQPDADPGLAADWHVRWSPVVLRKIDAAIDKEMCRPGEHRVPQEESNRRRTAAASRQPPPTRRPGAPLAPLGTDQLATREFWDAFYHQAVDADLDWRRAREQHEPRAEPGVPRPGGH